jgi:hypothetical protein
MNLHHMLDFDFQSAALGCLRIGSLNAELRRSIDKDFEHGDGDAQDLARRVFLDTAHHVTGIKAVDAVCGGPPVTTDDAKKLEADELEKFAERYGAHFFGKHDGKGPTGDQPKGVHYLVFRIGESIVSVSPSPSLLDRSFTPK